MLPLDTDALLAMVMIPESLAKVVNLPMVASMLTEAETLPVTMRSSVTDTAVSSLSKMVFT